MKPVLLLALLLLSAGCHKKVNTQQRFEAVDRGGYIYQRMNDGEVVVAARTAEDLDNAMDEIGCGRQYICQIQPTGDLYQILQRLK